MDDQIKRARSLLPSIVITVLSMIQALALEIYWSRLQELDYLFSFSFLGLLTWVQILVTFMGIVQIWLMYVSLLLRFVWLPTIWDMVIPFGIGLLEFLLIAMMGVEQLGYWMLTMSALFVLATMSMHTAFVRARKDPENSYFFKGMERATWRDYRETAAGVLVMAAIGSYLHVTGEQSYVALVGILIAGTLLGLQAFLTHRYWMRAMVPGEEG